MKNRSFIAITIVFVLLALTACQPRYIIFPFPGDDYSVYQWGLYNEGQLIIDSTSISTEAYEAMYRSFLEWVDSGGLGVPPMRLSPEDLIHTRTQSLPGADMNVKKALELYDMQKASGAELRDVTVAIIDTGIDTGHLELMDALWVNADEIPGDGIDNDQNGYIDDINGYNFFDHNNVLRSNMIADIHGTHAAGTIGAKRGNGGMSRACRHTRGFSLAVCPSPSATSLRACRLP